MLTPRVMSRTTRTPDGHLLWTGGLANGRPATKHNGKTVYVKRLVWEEVNGPIPEGAVVISTCGERTCIEPSHLALSAPGRYAGRRARGRYTSETDDSDRDGSGSAPVAAGSPAARQ
jgi:hypothetical protein